MSIKNDLTNGIARENPIFRLVLGTCPTLATSLSVSNGIGMGLAATVVLVGSNAIISALRNVIPDKVRIPAYIVVIAAFVTIVDKLMAAFVPSLHSVLGIFIPLIVVNCIILARAESFASKNPVINSMADGLGMGMGFTLSLVLMSTIREILGTGKLLVAKDFGFAGFKLFNEAFAAKIMISPPGGFITFGLLMALINYISQRREARANGR
ncbi:MAG TPA: electron transport complex subunit RsxE [Firmicutes bacterium]|jgi:electron transport complex protein RnfE|nr:electron transport complex subunit RsxE [Bacillota bacterium]HBE07152.1 electron transport complex subunit RsxE [Bacillota bacterium]HBG45096.1 electron transport complex subunit RsxE [Bacillota bacterium]HBL67907.1 electron transport complex subunit RsxE [Bacillota bacterium]HCF90873.1 electron transport complex subunit RsxE [Bacillota bacterium]